MLTCPVYCVSVCICVSPGVKVTTQSPPQIDCIHSTSCQPVHALWAALGGTGRQNKVTIIHPPNTTGSRLSWIESSETCGRRSRKPIIHIPREGKACCNLAFLFPPAVTAASWVFSSRHWHEWGPAGMRNIIRADNQYTLVTWHDVLHRPWILSGDYQRV